MTKQELRKQLSHIARITPGPEPAVVASRICSLVQFQQADYVLGYIALPSEIDISMVMDEAVRRGKTIAFPCENPGEFAVGQADWREKIIKLSNKTGSIDTEEVLHLNSKSCKTDLSHKKGIILVPGLAFTEFGTRLGRGAGYYDQLFSLIGTNEVTDLSSVGVCKATQLLDDLPMEPHDRRVDVVITF